MKKQTNFYEMDFPQQTSLTKDTFLYNGKNAGDFWDYKEKKWFSRKKIWNYIDKFWEKHIGEQYDECRQKLINNLREKFGNSLNDFYVENTKLKPHTAPHIKWELFYYDENGLIVDNRRKREHKSLKIDNRVIVGYTFDSNDFDDVELDIAIKLFGKDRLYHMFNEIILPEEYEKLKSLTSFYWFSGRKLDINRKANPIYEGEVVEIERGTPKYAQYFYEKKDASKKEWRLFLKKRREKNETLLHRIVESRKAKEKLENSLTIERLGFYEKTSFRGEEYHGGKKKNTKKGL